MSYGYYDSYEELSRIAAVTAQTVEVPIMNDVAEERVEIPILLDGRFVLEGTLKLNEPFEENNRYSN